MEQTSWKSLCRMTLPKHRCHKIPILDGDQKMSNGTNIKLGLGPIQENTNEYVRIARNEWTQYTCTCEQALVSYGDSISNTHTVCRTRQVLPFLYSFIPNPTFYQNSNLLKHFLLSICFQRQATNPAPHGSY